MEFIAVVFIVVGLVMAAVGGIWLLIEMFKESIMWGIGGLLCGILPLIFVFLHWEEGGNPFMIGFGGGILYFLGLMMIEGGGF